MLIAMESGTGIGEPGFIRGMRRGPIYDSLDVQNDRPRLPLLPAESSSLSTSSIGKDSDASGRESEDDEDGATGEVQSAYKGALQGMESLEESLPIRRGISSFYAGKSKSFTSLSDAVASCASAKDLAKAENAYTRSRRNLLASRIFLERPHKNLLRSPGGGITKRPSTPTRSTLRLAVAMSSCCPRTNAMGHENFDNCPQLLPPKSAAAATPHLCSFSSRSFSSGDLAVLKSPPSPIGPRDEQ